MALSPGFLAIDVYSLFPPSISGTSFSNILLQNYSNLTSEEHPSFYDRLRKNYKIRHEYTNRVMDMCKYSGSNIFGDEIEKKLKKLGFKFKSI